MSPKRTSNQVPAKAALVLTGSAIALAGYLGASSNTGHEGRGPQQTGLAAALTVSPQPQAPGPINAGPAGLGNGRESGSTGGPGPIALTAYGTPRKHPQTWRRHPKRRPEHLEKHRGVKRHAARRHRARRHGGRLHGTPWQIAGSLMPAHHWASWQFHYLNLLWMRESGWNSLAYNHSSGAYGIPQAVPGDKMAAAGPNWRTSARTQIIWGMGYIQSRYGNPWNAWEHELRYGWY